MARVIRLTFRIIDKTNQPDFESDVRALAQTVAEVWEQGRQYIVEYDVGHPVELADLIPDTASPSGIV